MIKLAAVLVLLASPALATTVCMPASNKDVLAVLEKNVQETVHFVGISDGNGFPVELTLSATGTWTVITITPKGVCILAAGHDWQAVEPKPPGVEN